MKLTPELYVLALIAAATALMWIPYMLARIVTRGVGPTLANPADPAFPPDPAWAERGRCARERGGESRRVRAARDYLGANEREHPGHYLRD